MATYLIGEAGAKLDEILRKVKEGETVLLMENGEAVAEIRPLGASDWNEGTLRQLEAEGILSASTEPRGEMAPLAIKPGALARFLESRR
jgi:antitoxin (DNA-binding transcriptional repressor) of toxin-antitoxin stability system